MTQDLKPENVLIYSTPHCVYTFSGRRKCLDTIWIFGLYNKTSNHVTFENTVFRTSLSLVFFCVILVSSCYLLTKVTWLIICRPMQWLPYILQCDLSVQILLWATVCEKYPNYSIIFRFRSCIISHFCFSSIISVFVNAWSMYCFSRMQFGIHIII